MLPMLPGQIIFVAAMSAFVLSALGVKFWRWFDENLIETPRIVREQMARDGD